MSAHPAAVAAATVDPYQQGQPSLPRLDYPSLAQPALMVFKKIMRPGAAKVVARVVYSRSFGHGGS